ncbi:MAG: hypothetical protein CVU86_08725 [Firmicutes bacterium HGW-Firmicutes-11]|jgi:prepilin-type N-terminal cleavage/methylation domain-containing protein|nr:MAG: hypothetical protein CVU86_08725 [Firmicutes bacterium HGW-Firmicutes-11]
MKTGRRRNQGFTLVEIIIVMVLVVLMVTTGYYIFDIVTKYYQTTSDQVSAQENFRLVADQLTIELGTAEYVTLLDDASDLPVSNLTDGGIKIYVDVVSATENAVFQSIYNSATSSFEDETMIGYPVKELGMEFKAMDDTAKILSIDYWAVEFETADKYLVENILLQNGPMSDISVYSKYEAVYYTSY